MGGARNVQREAQVRILVSLAQTHGVPSLPGAKAVNASRQKILQLVAALNEAALPARDREQCEKAKAAYDATFAVGVQGPDAPEQPNSEDNEADGAARTWKFQAVQLTYSAATQEWSSHEAGVLKRLFDRFTAFILSLASSLMARGASTTMERGVLSPQHVHCHAYLHLSKPFHRRGRSALEVFRFEGISPHLEPNTASGKAFTGAVRYGHFYVVVQKIGSLSLGSVFSL